MKKFDLIEKYEDKMRERYISLKTAILDLEAIKYDFADCGARDSEPDRVCQGMIWAAYNEIEPRIFVKPEDWRLFTDTKGSNKCAKLMAKKMAEIVDLIMGFSIFCPEECRAYLRAYCWRFID